MKKASVLNSLSNAVRTLAMVRAWGLEPQRLAAREPKGYVTLVKDFQSPPYHEGRTSFQRFKRYFGRDRPNIC